MFLEDLNKPQEQEGPVFGPFPDAEDFSVQYIWSPLHRIAQQVPSILQTSYNIC